TQVRLPSGDAIYAVLSPPFRHLGWVGDRLEDALRGSGYETFGVHRVQIGSNGRRCHEDMLLLKLWRHIGESPRRELVSFHKILELFDHARPAAGIILRRGWIGSKSTMGQLHMSTRFGWR